MQRLSPSQRLALKALPKTEQHLHFEAALPLAVAQARFGDALRPLPFWWEPGFRYDDFGHFQRVSREYLFPFFSTPEAYVEAAGPIFRALMEHNVRYVETSLNVFLLEPHAVDLDELLGRIRARAPAGMEVRFYLGLRRTGYSQALQALVERAIESPAVMGFDLHGIEGLPLEPWTADVWARARAFGKRNKAHAGEFGGPDSVRQVFEVLGVDRIQHGVRAIEDATLVRHLAERGVIFDLCPISNVRLRVCPSIGEHPLRRLLAAGIACTINSDDPYLFGNWLTDDLIALMEEGGFTIDEVVSLLKTGWSQARMPSSERDVWLGELDRLRLLWPMAGG